MTPNITLDAHLPLRTILKGRTRSNRLYETHTPNPIHTTNSIARSIHSPCISGGGADRDRTGGLLVANQALSQLSYSPNFSRQSSVASLQQNPADD